MPLHHATSTQTNNADKGDARSAKQARPAVGTDPWWILIQIDHHGGNCRMTELVDRTVWTHPRLTATLRSLEQAGLVEMRTHDGKTRLSLTDDGTAFAADWPVLCIDETWPETRISRQR